jgi:hypothetical protein
MSAQEIKFEADPTEEELLRQWTLSKGYALCFLGIATMSQSTKKLSVSMLHDATR